MADKGVDVHLVAGDGPPLVGIPANLELKVKLGKQTSLDHGGKSYKPGQTVKLPIHNALQLAAGGAVEVVS